MDKSGVMNHTVRQGDTLFKKHFRTGCMLCSEYIFEGTKTIFGGLQNKL